MSPRWVTIAGWIALAVAVVALEVWARLRPGRLATLADAVFALLRLPGARVVVMVGWLWIGWHLFVR